MVISAKKQKRTSPIWIFFGLILTVYAFSLIFLVGWGIMIALKSPAEYNFSGVMFSTNLSFESFSTALRYLYITVRVDNQLKVVTFLEMFYNTFVYALGCAFMQTTCTMIMAYMTTKYNYKFSKIITVLVYTLMVLPIGGSTAAAISLAKKVGTYGSMIGLFIMKFHFLGMYFLVYQARFKAIPNDFMDAARMDGASNFRIFTSIMVPMTKTTYFMVYMLYFMSYWSDYMTPLMFMPARPTMAYGLFRFKSSSENVLSIPSVTIAGSVIMMLPMFLIYVCFNKKIYGNLTFGGIKG